MPHPFCSQEKPMGSRGKPRAARGCDRWAQGSPGEAKWGDSVATGCHQRRILARHPPFRQARLVRVLKDAAVIRTTSEGMPAPAIVSSGAVRIAAIIPQGALG